VFGEAQTLNNLRSEEMWSAQSRLSSLLVSEPVCKTVLSEQICWVRAEPLRILRILAALGSMSRANRPTSSGRST
jgi:hypothetical protein